MAKRKLLRDINDIIFNNKTKFSEGEYLTLQNKLKGLYDEIYNDEEENNIDAIDFSLLCLREIPPHLRISHTVSFCLERVENESELGGKCVDIFLCQSECKLTYTELKDELIPLLQSKGLHVRIYYKIENEFTEDSFDHCFGLHWGEESCDAPMNNMINKIEDFPKTTSDYYASN